MQGDVFSFITMAMSVIGFITLWIKFGHDKGRQDEAFDTLKKKTEENKASVTDIKDKIHGQEIRIAEHLEAIATLKNKTEENKTNISEIKSKTHGLELRIAEFMGEMRVKIDDIKETVNELKPKGGRLAAKK
ncbi:MAG: hypothetical protein FWC12_11690 [Treponema sp.]|nr:hypothetical protein [Treponema sp.]